MKKFRLTMPVIGLLGLAGAAAVAYGTRWGPWAFSDSTEYIVSARNWLAGNGLGFSLPSGSFKPLTLHPPLYPLLLAAFGWLGADLLEAARWLNVVLFGATIFTAGAVPYRLFRSSWLAIGLSASTLCMPSLVDVSSGAMSELLFMFCTTLGLGLLGIYLVEVKRGWLIPAAMAAGLAGLSRYPGAAIIAAGMAGVLLLSRLPWKQRLGDLLVYGGVSLAPTAAWLGYIYTQAQTARQLSTGVNIGEKLIALRLGLVEVFWQWLPFPEHLPAYNYNLALTTLLVTGAGLGLLVAITLAKMGKGRRLTWPVSALFSFGLLWGMAALAYLAILAYAYLFTEPVPDLMARTLLPVQFSLVFILLAAALFTIRELQLPRWSPLVVLLVAFPFIIYNTGTSWALTRAYHQQGAGYTAPSWRESNTLEAAAQLPDETQIITNEAAGLLLWTDRPAHDFCSLPCNQPGNVRYGDNPADEIQRIFREEGAALVLFYPFCAPREQGWNAERMAELESLTDGLTELEYSCDGAIYFYP